MKQTNKYYVYVYLDPRKPGKYIYGEYEFDHEPFYVGEGNGERKEAHIKEAKGDKSSHKLNKIRSILRVGLSPIIILQSSNLLEKDAKELEILMIKVIGRNDLKTGPLTNLTNGGDGASGVIYSKEMREKRSQQAKGDNNGMFGKNHSKDSRKKEGQTRLEKIKNGEIIPTKHTEEWKKHLKNKFAINDVEILRLFEDGKTAKEIAETFNTTTTSIHRRLKIYNKKYEKFKHVLNIDEVHNLVIKGLFYYEIAKIFNVSESCISRGYRNSKYYKK